MHICDEYGIDLKGKKAMVVGKSLLVGQPAAIMLRKRGAEVKVFDRSSKNCLHE
jgi:methylenetetrahydrofolate dehydrogenase (NADP+)/methenyltetrahydrofolate cyclohydrolase